ncbi:hypothetical protein LJC07_05205 [Christensenellaceae bacterium OttesenSCG-928-L17]|nr:hypothetical protein [Christensenellaceae bacterium OttesenSCG-928-L17]
MKQTDLFDVDVLLKDTAKFDNAALPFETWKAELLEKAAQSETGDADVFVDEVALRRKKRNKIVAYAASAAAALLLMVGVLPLFAQKSTSFQNSSDASPEMLVMGGAALPESPQEMPGAAMDAAPRAEEAGDEAMMYSASMLASEEELAIAAVQNALLQKRGAADTGALEAAETAELVENAELTVQPLNGDDAYTLTLLRGYIVSLAGEETRYLVDAINMDVLGTIVE